MLLAAHVPQDLGAPDTASLTSNYSLTFVQQVPAAPISPRPRAASETGPRSVIPSLSRDSCVFAQAETGDKTLTADRRTDEWMDGRLGVYLNEIPQQDGGDREALLKKSTDKHFPCLLKQVTEALRVIHDILVQAKLFKHLQNICTTYTFLLKVTYK